jgi:hypothetical protein
MNIQTISNKVASLPDAVQQEVADYVEFLLQKYPPRPVPPSPFRFDWEGGFSGSYGNVTSVELQHKALEWR